MKIKDLFLKPIDRDIEGVIKADDDAHLKTEVEEYVITNEIARSLDILLEQYNRKNTLNNGVWISGFFGSGKSHLLKILALLLENHKLGDFSVYQTFYDKIPQENAFLRANLNKAVEIPSKSILFNIDQKSAGSTDDSDALLKVFAKVFDDFCGYYGNQGYVANFERQLDQENLFSPFKENFLNITGQTWEKARETFNIHRDNISKAFAKTTGNPEASSRDIIASYRDDYQISIDDFTKNVNEYIQKQEPGFRLNFFVDEVGQFIAENDKLMLNLQTIAESLATNCQGRSWLFVTSQEDMARMFGDIDPKLGNDFSKILARFQTKIHLSSRDVSEVIQKRLLEKNPNGEIETKALYATEHNNFGTLFTFPDGGVSYRHFKDEKEFISSYPFVPYQYDLFQESIRSLSTHNAFTGRHSSVGERSMLGVFQEVAKAIADKPLGSLGSFDMMFAGISTAIKSQNQSAIYTAEKQLNDAFAVRLLKALFLVKHVKSFKSSVRNLRVLMQSDLNQDITELEKKVSEALELLELNTLIQRNGDVYEYLTSEEQDIENEIKNLKVDNDELYKVYDDIFFAGIITDNKIRYQVNNQDYPFTKSIDGKKRGKEHELVIDFITSNAPFSGDLQKLKSHSLDKAELLIVLPADDRFEKDVITSIKTENYIKQERSLSNTETKNTILSNKALQNIERKKEISQKAAYLVKHAQFIVSGEAIDINAEDAKTRIVTAFNILIEKIYPNLRMLGKTIYSEKDIPGSLKASGTATWLTGDEALSEAEAEMLRHIKNNQRTGIRTSFKLLEDHFSTRPYGWYLAAIQCLIAQLVARSKLELWQDGTLLTDATALERALKNTYKFDNLFLRPVEELDPRILKALQDFHRDFFNEASSETDFRKLCDSIRLKARQLADDLQHYAQSQARYPFLKGINNLITQLNDLANKGSDYYRDELPGDSGKWLALKEEEIDPVRRFMAGQQVSIYDEIVSFLNLKKPDLQYFHTQDLERLQNYLNDPEIHKGNLLVEARKLKEKLALAFNEQLEERKDQAIQQVDEKHLGVQALEGYQALSNENKARIDSRFQATVSDLNNADLTLVVQNTLANFEKDVYPRILTELYNMSQATAEPEEREDHEETLRSQSIHRRQMAFESIRNITVDYAKYTLETEEDVTEYCQALERVLIENIRNNKRITL